MIIELVNKGLQNGLVQVSEGHQTLAYYFGSKTYNNKKLQQ